MTEFHRSAFSMYRHLAHDCACYDPQTKQTQLLKALLLVGGFALVECGVGLYSHSLALVAESGHLASDCLALLLAWLASRVAQSPPSWGWLGTNSLLLAETPPDRPNAKLEIWAALLNGGALIGVTLWIVWEAIGHLQAPSAEIASQPMILTAIAGLLVNGVNMQVLHQGSDRDLNLRAAFLHVVADALGALGVLGAALAVAYLHWDWADGAISLAIAALILISTVPLLVQSWQSL